MKNVMKLLAPLALAASSTVHADFIGGTIEASYWYAGVGGDATVDSTSADFESDLDFDNDSFFEIAASVEHPVPVVPNVKLRYTSLDQTETATITNGFYGFNNESVETNVDLSHFDLILYYEILDNWVSIDVGLDIKKFEGQLDFTADSKNELVEVDEFLPLPYAKAEIELPFTGMAFGAELAGVSYSGNGIFDARARIRQNLSLAFIELGYRTMSIQIDDLSSDDLEVDADYSGVYLSTGLDF